MGRTTLLDTRTVSYLELIGNGRAYVVPPYQRDYSWRQEQWEDLWNDVVEMGELEDGRHYASDSSARRIRRSSSNPVAST